MEIRYAASTHVGAVRPENQDALVVEGWVGQASELSRSGGLRLPVGLTWSAAVLDGMGGYAGGGIAAALAALQLSTTLRLATTSDSAEQWSARFTEASAAVEGLSNLAPDLRDMGATVAAVVIGDDRIVVLNVGDARVYRLWKGYFTQVSEDDRVSPDNHAITQALGSHLRQAADPHHLVVAVDAPTVLLLCSDGLSDYVPEERIKSILARGDEVGDIADALVDEALAVGAPDNTTVIVASITPAVGA